MHGVTLLLIGLVNVGAINYSRPLDAARLDQATLDAEGYGEKKAFRREVDGLRIALTAPGEKKGDRLEDAPGPPDRRRFHDHREPRRRQAPQARAGGQKGRRAGARIPESRPARPDDHPAWSSRTGRTCIVPSSGRETAPRKSRCRRGREGGDGDADGTDRAARGRNPPGPPAGRSRRRASRSASSSGAEGPVVRFQVIDGAFGRPRYLGQMPLGTNDIAGVKLFASNRNGAEAVDVLLCDLTIRADRITGLGTTSTHNVYGEVVYADPTAIEDGVLVLGGQPKTAPRDPQAARWQARGRGAQGPAIPKGDAARPAPAKEATAPPGSRGRRPAPAGRRPGPCGGRPGASVTVGPAYAERSVDGASPPADHRATSRGGPRAASEAEGEGQDPARRGREHPVRTDARAGRRASWASRISTSRCRTRREEGRRRLRPRSRRRPTGPTTSSPRRPGRRWRRP